MKRIISFLVCILFCSIFFGIEVKAEKAPQKERITAEYAIYELMQFGNGEYSVSYSDPKIRAAVRALEEARNSGADVSDLEAALPKLIQKAKYVDAKRKIDLYSWLINGSDNLYCSVEESIGKIEDAIGKAKKVGADVSDLEQQLPALLKKARIVYADQLIEEMRGFGEGKNCLLVEKSKLILSTKEAIEKAKQAGFNTQRLEQEFAAVVKSVSYKLAEIEVRKYEEYDKNQFFGYYFNPFSKEAKRKIAEAKQYGADVTTLEKRVSWFK